MVDVQVAVCVATCRRSSWLQRLVEALLAQADLPAGAEFRIIVCDNDPDGSARDVVAPYERSGVTKVIYVHEPRRGIARARNAAVDAARVAGSSVIVFIDDDEVPGQNWLAEMLAAQRRHNASVVVAPVVPEFEPGTPQWIISGGFFDRVLHPEGAELKTANSGNTLVLCSVFDRVGRFDDRFDLNGGEDDHFFIRAHLAGIRICFTRDASVRETVPLTRSRLRWLVQRSFRLGNSYVLVERMLLGPREWVLIRPIKILAKSATGLGRLAASPLIGRPMAVRGLQNLARAAGAALGLLGFNYQEYHTIHGR